MPKIYKVGGCVRDSLLGIDSKDIDFTFVLDDISLSVEKGFEKMTSWMTKRGYQIFLSTPDCFTIRAKFPVDHPNSGMVADFVMARKEVGYIEGTRQPILVLGNLEDDLARRDFTLNAMAIDEEGNLIDLFEGKRALEERILITPLPAHKTMLDDPLRFLRALRFSVTKGFEIHPDIFEAMRDPEIFEKLKIVVSAERIREELLKMFKADTVRTLSLLHEMNVLIPGFLEMVFSRGLWLKPTFEK